MKKIVRIVFVIGLLFAPLLTSNLFAQGTPGGPDCWPPPCVPIDGGISLLIAAGIGLGAKKAYDTRKKQ